MTWTESGFDLAVIGSGSAAFAAAIAATNQGKRVVMVERGTTGGTCVNVGCVPTKALLAAAEVRHTAQAAGRFPGLAPADVPVGFPALIGGKGALVEQLRAEKYADLAAGYGWEIVRGTAAFAGSTDEPVLEVALNDGGARRIEAAHYLIATGSAPWAPPVEGLEEAGYLTSTTAMELDALPESMVVVGGNAVGLEAHGDRLAGRQQRQQGTHILDHTAKVTSPCRATGQPVRLTATPGGPTQVEPATAVVSLVTPGAPTSVRASFCNQIHFFTSADAAKDWLAEHPDARVLPVADAFAVERPVVEQVLAVDTQSGCC